MKAAFLACALSALAFPALAADQPTLALQRAGRAAASSTSFLSTTSAKPTATLSLSRNRPSTPSCKCGYSRSGAYLPKLFSIDFTNVNTPKAISAAGMYITDTFDYNVGSIAPDGTTAYGQASNIRSAGSNGIALAVPGGQKAGGKVTGAEMSFQGREGEGMTRMLAEMEMLVDATPGTCQSMFTYTADYEAYSDEQDIEILAASLVKNSTIAPAGVQLTNYDPAGTGDNDFRIIPFPQDPSKAFHKYTIAWVNGKVEYLFDDVAWKGPTKFASIHASNLIINHWATGEIGFFGAPLPTKDVLMKVKNLKIYYATATTSKRPAGCSTADLCKV